MNIQIRNAAIKQDEWKTNVYKFNDLDTINKIDYALNDFVEQVVKNKKSLQKIEKISNNLIKQLNLINKKSRFIETEESEQLLCYIVNVLKLTDLDYKNIDIDSIREW